MLIIKSTAKFSLGNFYYTPAVISNNKSHLWITRLLGESPKRRLFRTPTCLD